MIFMIYVMILFVMLLILQNVLSWLMGASDAPYFCLS